ncbi:MAG: outer membrane protein transport protein, partial [Rikenellaceae bacterium]
MKLRKFSLFLLANLIALSLMAEGYQINSQSARQIGMGHLGTALKLGGESMLFNPAGLSYMNGKMDFSLGMTAIFSKVKYTNVAGDYTAKTDNPMGTPIFGYAGFKLSEKLFAGVSITNPAGNSLYWPDNWKGSQLAQDISLKAFSVQPTISYKFSEKFSIGAGLMIDFGDFEMNKGLMPVGALAAYLAHPYMPATYKEVITNTLEISPASLNLQGNAKPEVGFNVGILYSPNDALSFGLSYRSKVMMKVKDGKSAINYGTSELDALFSYLSNSSYPATYSPSIAGAVALGGQKFTAELPIPSNLNFGAAYKLNKKLLLSAELQYVGWKAYDTLVFKFTTMTSKSPKNFENSMIYRIGGEYKACEKMTVRIGFIYDTTPVDKMLYSAETPGANKFSLTCGFTYSPVKNLAIDFGFQYLNGAKIHGSSPQAAPLTAFEGDYKTSA